MELDIINILEEIAQANFINIVEKSIDINSVLYVPSNHDTLFIQIYNNQLYTRSPVFEERHHQIIRQLQLVLNKYTIPNTVFSYSTRDEYPNKNDFIFTHAIKKGQKTNNILAPCFTFDSYPEKDPTNFITYEATYNELIVLGTSSCDDIVKWENTKKPTLAFVGSVNTYNYRDINTNFSDNISVDIINLDAASGQSFIPRSALSNYRFLLHLNGNNGAYSSRLKYLLLVGSLVLYISNFNGYYDYQIEYWMNHPLFQKCIIEFKTIESCENYIQHDLTLEKSYYTAQYGFKYVKQILKPDNILLYWKILLEQYNLKIKNPVQDLIYHYKC